MKFRSQKIMTAYVYTREPKETRDFRSVYRQLRQTLDPDQQDMLDEFYELFGAEMGDRAAYFFQKGWDAGQRDLKARDRMD